MTDAQPLVFTDNPLNPLEEALYEGLADASRMGLFERLMLEADLYAVPEPDSPGGAPGDDGAKVLRQGEQLVLRGVVLNDGRNSVSVFTDPTRATAMFGEEARIIAMKGRSLLALMGETPALLNPDGGRGLLLNPDQIRSLLEHEEAIPQLRPVSGRAELHDVDPLSEPTALVQAIADTFKPPMVKDVWLARAIWPEVGQIGWFLDIRTDSPADEIKALVGRAVRGIHFGYETLDLTVGKPGGEPGVGIKII
ncbi:SseB family protein [Brevundimonas sp. Root1423]|uniref:SseB family protein n=1 Tax=Brevundimonas sp. Root1423 TaxID=1736462 RepID=UPI0006FE7618|nr:SseB family protein [Brevundimonas sp. Root1423]KQY80447.1 hypothetical protein ASD25_09980 [Brevundimonas sp. Root1423]